MDNIFSKEKLSYYKSILILAFPIVLQRVVELFVNLLDNLMVGQLGDVLVSSCSLAGSFNLLFSCASGGIISAGVIIAAQAWGGRNKDIIKKTITGCLVAVLLVTTIFFVLSQTIPVQIINMYTDKEQLFGPGSEYLRILSFSFFPYAITSTYTNIMRTTGSTKFGFIIEMINSIINAFLNYLLIFGNFGFPALGLNGAGIATVIARSIGLLITIVYIYFYDRTLQMNFKDLSLFPDKKLWNSIIVHGTPIMLSDTLMMLNSTVQTMITGRVSNTYIAANSIVHMIWQVAAFALFGFSSASAILIGNSIGKNDYDSAYKQADMLVGFSVIQGIIAALLVQIIAPILIPLYKVSDAVALTARQMSYSASFVVFALTMQQIIGKGVTRAGGMTKQYMLVEILSTFCFGLPLGYIAAFILKWPEYLIYIVIRLDYVVKALWGYYHIKKRDWIRKVI